MNTVSMSKVGRVLGFSFPQTDTEFLKLAEGHPEFISEVYANFMDSEELVEEIKLGANALDPQQFRHCEELVAKITRNYAFFEKSFNEALTSDPLEHNDTPSDSESYTTSHKALNNSEDVPVLTKKSKANIIGAQNDARFIKMKTLYKLLGAMACLAGVGLQAWARNNGVGRDSFLEITAGGQHLRLKQREITRRVQELVKYSEMEKGRTGFGTGTIMDAIGKGLNENPEFEAHGLEELQKIFAAYPPK